ncbi:hypothetical protein HZB01_00005 [Candidatus Woesearchaeota archaeon]|nr:hypothetical protein [Candidatus Woesearchaeota archaeon]
MAETDAMAIDLHPDGIPYVFAHRKRFLELYYGTPLNGSLGRYMDAAQQITPQFYNHALANMTGHGVN